MPTQKYLNVTSNTEQNLVKVAIQKSTGGYTYHLIEYRILLKLLQEDRHYYEIIGNNPIKPYFDIDVKVGQNGYEDFSIAYYLNQIIYYFKEITGHKIERKQCVVMNSSSPSKKSYHIVINCGIYFKHRSDNEAFVKNIKRYDSTLEYIDASVYTTNRNMRMINQSKVDKGIMLKMESMHFIKDTLIHNYNPSMIPEIFEIKVDDEPLGEEESDYSQMETKHIEYTEEEIIEMCSLLNYERGEYNDWIKIGTALKNGGYDWSVFEEVSKNLKNYDSVCNFEWKFRSLDETKGNLGTIVNMVKEDNPEEYYEWKMRRQPSCIDDNVNISLFKETSGV